MTFTVVEKSNRGRERGVSTAPAVQIAKYTKRGTILVNAETATALGWAPRDKIEVSIGSGEDAGWIALRKGPKGFVLSKAGNRITQLKVTCPAILAGVVKSAVTECKYQISDSYLFIMVPARLRPELADPLARSAHVNGAMAAAY